MPNTLFESVDIVIDRIADAPPAQQNQALARFWRLARKYVTGLTLDDLSLQPRLVNNLKEDLNAGHPFTDYNCSLIKVSDLCRLSRERLKRRVGIADAFINQIVAALEEHDLALSTRVERTPDRPILITELDLPEKLRDSLQADMKPAKANTSKKYQPTPWLRPLVTLHDIQGIGRQGLIDRDQVGSKSVKAIDQMFDNMGMLLPP